MWQEISINAGVLNATTTFSKLLRNQVKWGIGHDGVGVPASEWYDSKFRRWVETVMIYRATSRAYVRPCMYQAWFGYGMEVLGLRGATLLSDIGENQCYSEWLDDFDARQQSGALLLNGALVNLGNVHFTDPSDSTVASFTAIQRRTKIDFSKKIYKVGPWLPSLHAEIVPNFNLSTEPVAFEYGKMGLILIRELRLTALDPADNFNGVQTPTQDPSERMAGILYVTWQSGLTEKVAVFGRLGPDASLDASVRNAIGRNQWRRKKLWDGEEVVCDELRVMALDLSWVSQFLVLVPTAQGLARIESIQDRAVHVVAPTVAAVRKEGRPTYWRIDCDITQDGYFKKYTMRPDVQDEEAEWEQALAKLINSTESTTEDSAETVDINHVKAEEIPQAVSEYHGDGTTEILGMAQSDADSSAGYADRSTNDVPGFILQVTPGSAPMYASRPMARME
jgi:hypothetical protein